MSSKNINFVCLEFFLGYSQGCSLKIVTTDEKADSFPQLSFMVKRSFSGFSTAEDLFTNVIFAAGYR